MFKTSASLCPECALLVVPPPPHRVGEIEREITEMRSCNPFIELWQVMNSGRLGEKDEGLPLDNFEDLVQETHSCDDDSEGSKEDVHMKIKSNHHYLRKEPTFALLYGVLRYISAFKDGDKMNIGRLLEGANLKVACRSRSTGRPTTLRNSAATGKRRYSAAHHQLMYVIAQVNENAIFSRK